MLTEGVTNDDNLMRTSSPKNVSTMKRNQNDIKYTSDFYENDSEMIGKSLDSGFRDMDDSVGLSGDLKKFLENREDWQEIQSRLLKVKEDRRR